MENELRKAIEKWVEYQIEQNKELEKKYPPNPPNDVCKTAYMKGLLIENSFEPEVGEMNELFEVEHESLSGKILSQTECLHWSYTSEQKEEVKKALAAGVPKATILTYFYPEVSVERISSYRKKH